VRLLPLLLLVVVLVWVVLQEPELSALRQPGIDVQLHDQPHTLLEDFFYVSGHVPRVTSYEAGNPNHASQWVSLQSGCNVQPL
jgi:hypothetical protein